MGFYGNITNTSQTQFSFDKVYPNRKAMDENAANDGIYPGRFILVDYNDMEDETAYGVNFQIDKAEYNTAEIAFFRGYDSTVWQKTFSNNEPKYVMVAELNSIVPTIEAEVLAPTQIPKQPNFSADSSNVQYFLQLQPSWGLRVKAHNADLTIPQLNNDGTETGNRTVASAADAVDLTSDGTTTWKNYQDNGSVKYLRVLEDLPDNGDWVDEEKSIEAAIYFNKAGFDPDLKTTVEDSIENQILLTPTGYSGKIYDGQPECDVQELSIILPGIGNTIAKVWDLVYGKPTSSSFGHRITDIKWPKANSVPDKRGPRLIADNTQAPSTDDQSIASAINSVFDLMGNIIYAPEEEHLMPADKAKDNFIYYDPDQKCYVYRKRSWEFVPYDEDTIPNNYEEYAEKELEEFDGYYLADPVEGTEKYNYLIPKKFDATKQYVDKNTLEGSMVQAPIVSTEYVDDGTCFYRDETTDEEVYIQSMSSEDFEKNYAKISDNLDQPLSNNIQLYEPGKYFYFQYEDVTDAITENNYTPNILYYDLNEVGAQTSGPTRFRRIESSSYPPVVDSPNGPCRRPMYEGEPSSATMRVVNFKYYKKVLKVAYELVKRTDREYYRPINPGFSYNKYHFLDKIDVMEVVYDADDYLDDIENGIHRLQELAVQGVKLYKLARTETTGIEINDILYTPANLSVEITEEDASISYFRYKFYQVPNDESNFIYTDDDFVVVESNYLTDLNHLLQDGFNLYYCEENNLTHLLKYTKVTNFNVDATRISSMRNLIVEPLTRDTTYRPLTYYYKNKDGHYVLDMRPYLTNGTIYYRLQGEHPGEILDDKYYVPDKYYTSVDGAIFELSSSMRMDINETYYEDIGALYVLSDATGTLNTGVKWPSSIKTIPEGVQLATREENYIYEPIQGFADTLGTIHGLILELYRQLNPNDKYVRDSSFRGVINQVRDLLHYFKKVLPNHLLMTNDLGTVSSAVVEGDNFITASANNSKLSISHKLSNISQQSVAIEQLTNNGTFSIQEVQTDNAGHVTGITVKPLKLPAFPSFKNFSTIEVNGTIIQANADNDTLALTSNNDLIALSANNKTISIAHKTYEDLAGSTDTNEETTLTFGDTIHVPSFTVDAAGHITSFETQSLTLPTIEEEEPIELPTVVDEITADSTDDEIPSAKAVYALFQSLLESAT